MDLLDDYGLSKSEGWDDVTIIEGYDQEISYV